MNFLYRFSLVVFSFTWVLSKIVLTNVLFIKKKLFYGLVFGLCLSVHYFYFKEVMNGFTNETVRGFYRKIISKFSKIFFYSKEEREKITAMHSWDFLITVKLQKQVDAFLRPTYIGIIMQLLDLRWQYQTEVQNSELCYVGGI